MKNKKITFILFILAFNVHAADRWFAPDKLKHVLVSAFIASTVTVVCRDELSGFLASTAVGAMKEVYDYQHQAHHSASWKDFGADLFGAYFGSKIGHLMIVPDPHGLTISLAHRF